MRLSVGGLRGLRPWMGVLLGAICLILAFRQTQVGDLLSAFSGLDPLLVFLALLTVLATMFGKTLRWRLLFHPRRPGLHFIRLLSALLIGQTLNALFPSRVGDLGRAYLIGETEGVSKPLALGTVVLEKILDGSMMLAFLALLFSCVPLPPWLGHSTIWIAVLCGALLLLLLAIARKGEALHRLGEALVHLTPERMARPLSIFQDGMESVGVFRSLGSFLSVMLLSLAIWVLAASTNYLTLAAMHIRAPLWVSPLLLVVLQVGGAIPSSPGKLGVFHYLSLATLNYGGVDRTVALSYGIVLHLLVFGPMILAGIFFILQESLSLQRLASLPVSVVSDRDGSCG